MKEFSLEEARKLGEEWKKILNLEPYEIKIDKMPLAEVNQQKGPDESFITFPRIFPLCKLIFFSLIPMMKS